MSTQVLSTGDNSCFSFIMAGGNLYFSNRYIISS